jgi:HAD superfamily 5'-nucleotidase-like hydrolase
VGFDMDYTLAQYNTDFELLAYEGAKKKLVEWLGYPTKVLSFEYQDSIPRRGCMVDRKRGNILKLDQHRYVRAVEHGLTALSREQRKSVYRASYQETETFTGKEFSNVDTPFSLVDACLFAQLVDLKDRTAKAYRGSSTSTSKATSGAERTYEFGQATTRSQKNAVLNSKSYSDMWADLRRCIDRCHRDGAIKLTVAQDPAKYIVYDEKRKKQRFNCCDERFSCG